MLENIVGSTLQTILSVAIEVLLPIALGFLVKLIHNKIQEVKAAKHTTEFGLAQQVVQRLVQAAEQLGLIGAIKDIGEEKKRYVIDLAEKELARRGIVMDLDTLDALIEAEVHESFTSVEQELSDLFDLGGEASEA